MNAELPKRKRTGDTNMDAHITGADLKQIGGKRITLGGKEYELVLDFNAICDLEEKYGSIDKAFSSVTVDDGSGETRVSMKDVRFILCALLRHTDDNMTERRAGKLITASNMQEIMDGLGTAFGAGKSDGDEAKNVESPQEA